MVKTENFGAKNQRYKPIKIDITNFL